MPARKRRPARRVRTSSSLQRQTTPGANVALMQTLLDRVLDRVDEITKIWGSYAAYVAVITIIGIVSLHFARPDTVFWIVALVGMAVCAPLFAEMLAIREKCDLARRRAAYQEKQKPGYFFCEHRQRSDPVSTRNSRLTGRSTE